MSGISTRIDKGQTRFAPKLKARPSRSKTTASEDGTPAPTPSISGSDSGTFGASLLESEAGSATTTTITTTTVTASSSVAASLNAVVKESSSRRLSTTVMSPPSTTTRTTITAPQSPHFSPTKVQREKSSQPGTAISFPSSSEKPTSEASSSTSTSTIGKPITVGSSKPTKGASIISVPSARSHTERDDAEDEESTEGSASSRKRSKGKHVVRTRIVAEDGEEETEDGEEEMPDYSDTPMHEFTKDMGTGKRSKVYFELLKQEEEKRRLKRLRRRELALQRKLGRGASVTPAPFDDDNDSLADEFENQATIKHDEKEEKDTQTKREPSTPTQQPPPPTRTLAPQVRIVDGRIELDVDSLLVDHATVDAIVDQGPMEYVEESSITKFVNSASYSKKSRSEKWSEEDTDRFYEALSQWGTDFGIICRLFPGKSRIAVRNKFKREDRLNKTRVEHALHSKRAVDLDEYSQITRRSYPEVDELEAIKKLPEEEDLLPDLNFAEEYQEDAEQEQQEEEIVEEVEEEEIVGMVGL
ncbi:Transcription factor TFIIIB component B [Mortierella sp. GBA30]|nr:Transcription factor TFIIIB component B [Mortierella sp. GBA30]